MPVGMPQPPTDPGAPRLRVLPEVHSVSRPAIALRHWLHAHPELGFEEQATADLIARLLGKWGFDVARGVGRTGLVGSLSVGRGRRSIGLRAEMDALPIVEQTGLTYASRRRGVMHACGHDGHLATVLAAARVLAATRGFSGTLHVIFQPAEEGLGGAQAMLNDGLFERFPCDRLYGFHNTPGLEAGRFGVRDGAANASQDTATIMVSGRGGHGARPHLAIDPVVAASHVVIALQTLVSRETHPDDMAVITVGSLHAGEAANVIAETAELRLSVRARSEAVRARLRERIAELAVAQAAVHRAQARIDYRLLHPVTINDSEAATLVRNVVCELGGETALVPEWPASTASDDMGLLLQRVPGCYFNVGNGIGEGPGDGGCPVHHPRYDFNDHILPSTASVFVALVRSYLGGADAKRQG
jgi:hippurate hydrolase